MRIARVLACEVAYGFDAESPLFVNASLQIERGESIAILGPSGIGKSTLLSILGKMVAPTTGSVRYEFDRSEVRSSARVSPVGWILQDSTLFPNRTVSENLALPLLLAGAPRAVARERAIEAAHRFGIGSRIDAKARHLSGGERQRVGIARCLVSDPDLILADEPTGQLDSDTTRSVLNALIPSAAGPPEHDSRQDFALVVVTHDTLVADQCDRTLMLAAGGLTAA